MDETWIRRTGSHMVIKVLYISCLVSTLRAAKLDCESDLDKELKRYVDGVLSVDEYSIIPGVVIERAANVTSKHADEDGMCGTSRSFTTIENYVKRKLHEYTETHVLSVNVPATARFFTGEGAQLVKSMLIAMFLPSLLGAFGKMLGKGLSTFSGISGASTGINNQQQPIEDFEFKDTDPYANDPVQDYGGEGADTGLSLNVAGSSTPSTLANANSRFGIGNRVAYTPQNDNYYMRKPTKKTDYKVFHKIPTSSLLLTSYDPFYSPLLSRLDAVFQQLGLGDDKSPATEKCRERLVCLMYANPAKYAPYSNLVSAQLSRELNELRKPASDNPEILRFFRYMKAAKDGQDDEECPAHGGCASLNPNQASPAILTTYNQINKLVKARKLN